jgi:hypothetical protein
MAKAKPKFLPREREADTPLFGTHTLYEVYFDNKECLYVSTVLLDAMQFSWRAEGEWKAAQPAKPRRGFPRGHQPWNKGRTSSSWKSLNSMQLRNP